MVVKQIFNAVTFRFYRSYTFFDMNGIFHNLKKTEVKTNYEVDRQVYNSLISL